jgi:hypothetical protein
MSITDSGQGGTRARLVDTRTGRFRILGRIRLFFYTGRFYGVADSLNFTLVEMHDSLAQWYR